MPPLILMNQLARTTPPYFSKGTLLLQGTKRPLISTLFHGVEGSSSCSFSSQCTSYQFAIQPRNSKSGIVTGNMKVICHKVDSNRHLTGIRPTTLALISTSSFLPNQDKTVYTAVVRYDNNCVTIPFVGSKKEAIALKDKMTKQQHKHHIFLMETARQNVLIGPYEDLEQAKDALNSEG